MQYLQDQFALVTGATKGIGRAIAIKLAELGASLYLLARDAGELETLAGSLNGHHTPLPCDLADDASLEAAVARVKSLDIVVHSAAVYAQGPLESAPVADFDLQYRVNLRAPYLLTQRLLPLLKQRAGQIVFINSTTGVMTRPGVTQYAAVKHGLRGLADCLRAEVAGDGVRVISVYPGQTATPMQAYRHSLEKREYHPEKLIQPADVAEALAMALTLARTAEVTDLHIRPSKR